MRKHTAKKNKASSGFTLVEMIVAVGLFTVVAAISLGAVLTIFDSNNKSQSSKTVVDNLNLALENMTRTVRFGRSYHCGVGGNLAAPLNCDNGDSAMSVSFGSNVVVYRLCGTSIKMSETGSGVTDCDDARMQAVTSPDTVVEHLKFYIFGADSDDLQPYVVAVIKGYVGKKPTTQTVFSLQTMMSQRNLDHNL